MASSEGPPAAAGGLGDEVDVLIVGAGPVGLTAGILLRRLGLRVAVVERREGPQRAPAAHVINARTFEVWRQAGVDVDALLGSALSVRDGGEVHWVTKLGGTRIGSLPFERQGDEVLAYTPTPLRNLSQHHLEPSLRDELEALGVPVAYGHAWSAADQDEAGVRSTVTDPDGRAHEVRSTWLLGCDGAGSPVRRWLGIEPVGPHRIQSFLMVHLAADFRALLGDRPGVLHWVCDEDAGGTFVAHDPDREWVYMRPVDPDTEDLASYTPERCADLVRAALDPAFADVPFEVLDVATWVMTAQVAERYRSGRVLLAGDAAHRFPPTGGLGLNSGVQDVHNLAWKLAAVLAGAADASLIDTYEAERRPVAEHNAATSLDNAFRLIEVPIAIAAAHEAGVAPEADPGVAAAIAAQATHFDMLGLQLGYVYSSAAVVDDGSEPVAVADPVREYVPTTRPGARLPHGFLDGGTDGASTLDLVPLDRPVLFVGPSAAADLGVDLLSGDDRLRIVAVADGAPGLRTWWDQLEGVGPSGMLLVRPDQHIAARWADTPFDLVASVTAARSHLTLLETPA